MALYFGVLLEQANQQNEGLIQKDKVGFWNQGIQQRKEGKEIPELMMRKALGSQQHAHRAAASTSQNMRVFLQQDWA